MLYWLSKFCTISGSCLYFFFRVQPERDSAGLTDFDKEPVQVKFQPGEKGPKSVFFDIANDSEDEEDERFKVALSSDDPVGLDEPAFVNIIDDDGMCPSGIFSVYKKNDKKAWKGIWKESCL